MVAKPANARKRAWRGKIVLPQLTYIMKYRVVELYISTLTVRNMTIYDTLRKSI